MIIELDDDIVDKLIDDMESNGWTKIYPKDKR
jgi:hypothetical protein